MSATGMVGPLQWPLYRQLDPKTYTCGNCGCLVGSGYGYSGSPLPADKVRRGALIYLCPNCGLPTVFHGEKQMPGVAYGASVEHLPEEVAGLYAEARNRMAVNSYTAAVLASRKLLMHIAVSQGGPNGGSFAACVDYLVESGSVPRNAHKWIDHIRKKGNEANHEICLMARRDAEGLLTFIEMLLKLVFEYPNKVP